MYGHKITNRDKISRNERRRSMSMAIILSIGSIVSMTCGAGNVLSLAAIKLGASEFYLGLFTFVSVAPFILSLFTMSTIETAGKIKVLLTWYSLAAVFTIPLLFMPLAASMWPAWAGLVLLAATNALRNGTTALGSTGWFPLLQDIVPKKYTARFFAKLRTSWQTANLICLIGSALILGSNPGWARFEILFVLAFIGQVVTAVPIAKMVEKPNEKNVISISIYARIKEFLMQKNMRHYTLYVMIYIIAANGMEPFKIKLRSDMGFSYGFILAATAMVGFGAVISLRPWGAIADKFGNRAIFSISHIGMLISTGGWLLVQKCSTSMMGMVMTLYFLWSVFNSGNTLAQTNYMLREVPSNKQNYMNLIVLAQRIATAVSPLLAGMLLHFFRNCKFNLVHINIGIYDLLFAINSLMFVIPHLMRTSLRAKTDLPTSNVVFLITRPLLVPFPLNNFQFC